MKPVAVISIKEARKIMRRLNAPPELLEEATVIDIINRIDTIAYLYISKTRRELDVSATLEDDISMPP